MHTVHKNPAESSARWRGQPAKSLCPHPAQKQFWIPQHFCTLGPPRVLFISPEAVNHQISRENSIVLSFTSILSHIHTYWLVLYIVRLLSQCLRQGRCPFIWTKPGRKDSLDLISKLLHQFISIHTMEQPQALQPTPHQQLSFSFRNLCPNVLEQKKNLITKSKRQDLSACILNGSSIMACVCIFSQHAHCSLAFWKNDSI